MRGFQATLAMIFITRGIMAATPETPKTPANGGWTKLCNGRNLDGWEKVNTGGTWKVENGIIIARRDPPDKGASWLVTKKDYGDFILRLKYKSAYEKYNSGVLIRDPAHAKLNRPAYSGFEVIIAQGQKDENTNAAIYYEANAYTQVLHAGGWAEFEIRCIGDHIVTYMNGKKMAETHSRRSYRGGIGLHLHGGEEPAENWWKDLEINELTPAPRPFQLAQEKMEQEPGEFVPLYTPQSLEQDFTRYGDQQAWSVEKDTLRGNGAVQRAWLVSRKTYGNFIMTFEFKVDSKGESGVGFRIPAGHAEDGFAGRGYELALDPDDVTNPAGSIYNVARSFVFDPNLQKVYKDGLWNRARIYATGDHLVVYINLTKTAEVQVNRSLQGRVGFEIAPGAAVEYRNVNIKAITSRKGDLNARR
jgi:hypothetical protein